MKTKAPKAIAPMPAHADAWVKTSLKLPQHLWRAAHIRALDDHCEFQQIVARALGAYLEGAKS